MVVNSPMKGLSESLDAAGEETTGAATGSEAVCKGDAVVVDVVAILVLALGASGEDLESADASFAASRLKCSRYRENMRPESGELAVASVVNDCSEFEFDSEVVVVVVVVACGGGGDGECRSCCSGE